LQLTPKWREAVKLNGNGLKKVIGVGDVYRRYSALPRDEAQTFIQNYGWKAIDTLRQESDAARMELEAMDKAMAGHTEVQDGDEANDVMDFP